MREGVDEAVARLTTPVTVPDPSPEPATVSEIISAMTSSRWRRSAVDEQTRADISAKVADRLQARAPIEFTVPFGGYKASDQPSAPELNWAEVMWLAHLRRFAAGVARQHAPGVRVTFTYYGHALDLVNGLPLAEQERYIEQLRHVAARFSDARVGFDVFDLAALHGGAAAFRGDLQRAIAAAQQEQPSAAQLASAWRNAHRRVAPADGSQYDTWVYAAARACMAMEALPQRRKFNKGEHRIQIAHIRGPQLSLHLGSTRTTTMQPWVATGFLRAQSGDLVEALTRAPLVGATVPVDHVLVDVSPQLRSIVVTDS